MRPVIAVELGKAPAGRRGLLLQPLAFNRASFPCHGSSNIESIRTSLIEPLMERRTRIKRFSKRWSIDPPEFIRVIGAIRGQVSARRGSGLPRRPPDGVGG